MISVNPELLPPPSAAGGVRREFRADRLPPLDLPAGSQASPALSKDCEICGAPFVKSRGVTRRVFAQRRFCSIQCGNKGRRIGGAALQKQDRIILAEHPPEIRYADSPCAIADIGWPKLQRQIVAHR